MRKSIKHFITVSWIAFLSLGIGNQTVLAAELTTAPRMKLFVYNRAQVDQDTLQKACEIAARIFRSAGIEVSVVVDPQPAVQGETVGTQPVFSPARTFFVQILSPEMANRLHLPSTVLGLAPGTPKEPGRNIVYVFDHVAARMAREQAIAQVSKAVLVSFPADKGQILGYAIAHEIGHVLLNLKAHTKRGVMQANWNRDALADIATGRLHFNSKETERLQEEVARRGIEQLQNFHGGYFVLPKSQQR